MRTREIGHFFPGGTVDAFDVWLELQGKDADGRVIFWSGEVEDDGKGQVEPGAHFYRALPARRRWQPDQQAQCLAGAQRAVRAPDSARRRRRGALPRAIPKDARGPITFTAKLNYRKFSHYYTQFAYAGQPKAGPGSVARRQGGSTACEYTFDPTNMPANVSGKIKGEIPDLPIIVLAEATAQHSARRRQDADRVDARDPEGAIANAGTTGASACCCRAT